jgi:HEAT repeats
MPTCAWVLLATSVFSVQPSEPPVIPSLIEALKDSDLETRAYSGIALAALGGKVVEPLLDALKDKDRNVRCGAAYAFGQMGIAAAPAKAQLLTALKDDDKDVRRQAAYALSRLLTAERERPVMAPLSPEPVLPVEPAK